MAKSFYHLQKKREFASEELEKVKTEIENLTYYWCEVNPNSVKDDVLEIIDKRISELKGENNNG